MTKRNELVPKRQPEISQLRSGWKPRPQIIASWKNAGKHSHNSIVPSGTKIIFPMTTSHFVAG